MRAKWLLIISILMIFALVTACDDQGTTMVSLQQYADHPWVCEMQPNEVLELSHQSTVGESAQWQFTGKQAGETTVTFRCAEGKYTPYMTYTYRVDEIGRITTTGVTGSVVPARESNKCLFQYVVAE